MWYSKYLQAFEQPCESVSDSIKQEIANKIIRAVQELYDTQNKNI